MRKISLIISLVFSISFCQNVQAADPESLLEKANQLGLASDPTWRKLLHYEFDDDKSAILSENFFVSPFGRENPEKELQAIIRAYFEPWE